MQVENLMYYHRRGVLFVHVRKNAGTTMELMLARQFGPSQNVASYHATAKEIWQRMGYARFARCYSFGFARNPWDKVVSHYGYFRRRATRPETLRHERDAIYGQLSFQEFIMAAEDDPRVMMSTMAHLGDGVAPIVSEVFQVEEFDAALAILKQRIGLAVRNRRANAIAHEHYSHYHTPWTRQVIERAYAADITAFGYRYEEK